MLLQRIHEGKTQWVRVLMEVQIKGISSGSLEKFAFSLIKVKTNFDMSPQSTLISY